VSKHGMPKVGMRSQRAASAASNAFGRASTEATSNISSGTAGRSDEQAGAVCLAGGCRGFCGDAGLRQGMALTLPSGILLGIQGLGYATCCEEGITARGSLCSRGSAPPDDATKRRSGF